MVDVNLGNVRGLQGLPGAAGANGRSVNSIDKTGTQGKVDTYTVTYSDGTTDTFQVKNGEDGSIVEVTQVVTEGNKIATITVDGVDTDIYSDAGIETIVTSWETVLSDLKVPSEKLTKQTLELKEDHSNKVRSTDGWSVNPSDDYYPSEKLVKEAIDNIEINVAGSFSDLNNLIDATSSGGTLVLERDYKCKSSSDDDMISVAKDITIIGNGHVIDGNNSARGFHPVTVSSSVVVNLYDLRIQNCVSNYGGGLIISNGITVNVVNTEFVNNRNSHSQTGYGGAIRVNSGGTVNVKDCSFIKNNAYDGGAIYISSSATSATIVGSRFEQNTATNAHADINSLVSLTVYDCDIPDIATSCYNVTNVPYQRELVSGTNIKTINNESILGSGDLEVGTSVGTFTDLQELISDENNGDIIILDNDYKFNPSTDGDIITGIPISRSITLIGNGHIIDGNNNVRIFKLDGNNVTFNLYDIILQNGYAGTASGANGGAIFLMHGTINVFNTMFNNNTAYMGGAIAVVSSSSTVLNMRDCSFNGNTATYYDDVHCTLLTTVYDCTIPNISTSCYNVTNITTESLSTSKQNVLESGTNIKTINNESLLGSGNITIQGGGVDIGTFTDLQTLITSASDSSTLILDKDYKYDSTTDSSLTYGVEISKNITIIGNGHIIDGNNSKRAFYINSSSNITVNLYDLRIQNTATNRGGAIIITSSGATVNINNIIFNKNTVTGYGGAIDAYDDTTVNINNAIFNQNTATQYSGGAIHASDATVTIRNSSFQDNTATNYNNIWSYNEIIAYDCIIPNISTSCLNVSNITTESLYDAIEGVEEDMLL